MNNKEGYKELEKIIGYEFKEKKFIITALSHSSYSNEVKTGQINNYERQEFLGDAVLELVVSEYLFKNYKDMPEGEMTKLRASLVCEPTLAFIAKSELELPKYILLGKGEQNTGGRNRDSIISDVFEAVIGAIYLDGGLICASEFINKYVINDMYKKIEFVDSKTRLQEKAQAMLLNVSYRIVSEDGPAHDRTYTCEVLLDNEVYGLGNGKTKKSAEQHAAYEALCKLNQ